MKRTSKVLCADGKTRTARIGEADTYFSAPAWLKAMGKSVKGFVTCEGMGGDRIQFHEGAGDQIIAGPLVTFAVVYKWAAHGPNGQACAEVFSGQMLWIEDVRAAAKKEVEELERSPASINGPQYVRELIWWGRAIEAPPEYKELIAAQPIPYYQNIQSPHFRDKP
jgi:hypothetical protein